MPIDYSLRFPVLSTTRLQLDQLSDEDADILHSIRSDEHIMHYIGRPRTTSRQDALDMISRLATDCRSGVGLTWALRLRGSASLIGIIGLYRINEPISRAELGYTLHSDHWGQGLMSEAIRSVMACAFEELGFNSLEAHTDPANERSIKALERNGFRSVGVMRQNFIFRGRYFDSSIWDIVATDLHPPAG